jgi:hypothetical protein
LLNINEVKNQRVLEAVISALLGPESRQERFVSSRLHEATIGPTQNIQKAGGKEMVNLILLKGTENNQAVE